MAYTKEVAMEITVWGQDDKDLYCFRLSEQILHGDTKHVNGFRSLGGCEIKSSPDYQWFC